MNGSLLLFISETISLTVKIEKEHDLMSMKCEITINIRKREVNISFV